MLKAPQPVPIDPGGQSELAASRRRSSSWVVRIRRQLIIAFIFVLSNHFRFIWRGGASRKGTDHLFSEEKCASAVQGAMNNADLYLLLSSEQKENAIRLAMLSTSGDYVDVDSSPSDCENKGMAGLAAAIAQRTVMTDPHCDRPNSRTRKRSIWLAVREENCVEEVRKLFDSHKFSVVDANSLADVPIRLLVGSFEETLPDSQIENIALLRFTSSGGAEEDEIYNDPLHVLFSLYRRVPIGGMVVFNGCSDGCKTGIDEFFTDGNHVLISSSARFPPREYHGTSFVKNDAQVRIPPGFSLRQIVIDPKVNDAWATLEKWHQETVKKFVGHVGTNKYQSFRYIEAMRHVVNAQKQRAKAGEEATINVCETGFNGGHSAMLFMSFLDRENGVNVHYWGWDHGAVRSARPTANKMKETYGENFHISWGDSKLTLTQAKEDMGGQRCHLIVVDGEHSKAGVVHDVENFLKVAAPGAVVFGDDCAPYKRTVPKSAEMLEGWTEFVRDRRLISVANYRNPELPSPGFVEGLVPEADGDYTLGL